MKSEGQLSNENINEVVKILSDFRSDSDEIGMMDLAMRITGLAKQTIYGKCSKREIPHMKQGKFLYFSKNELLQWIRNGKKSTREETING